MKLTDMNTIGERNWSLGRLSYLARLPLALGAVVIQTAKIVGKVLFVPWGYAIDKTLKYDIMGLRDLTLSVGRAAKRVIVAPKKEDPDFRTGMRITGIILTGNLTDKMKGRYDRMWGIKSTNTDKYETYRADHGSYDRFN